MAHSSLQWQSLAVLAVYPEDYFNSSSTWNPYSSRLAVGSYLASIPGWFASSPNSFSPKSCPPAAWGWTVWYDSGCHSALSTCWSLPWRSYLWIKCRWSCWGLLPRSNLRNFPCYHWWFLFWSPFALLDYYEYSLIQKPFSPH